MEMSVTGIVGLTAPVLFLYAYAMVSLGRWQAESLRFQAMNFFGAVAILISLSTQWNLPIFILECCWGLISIYGIVKVIKRRRDEAL